MSFLTSKPRVVAALTLTIVSVGFLLSSWYSHEKASAEVLKQYHRGEVIEVISETKALQANQRREQIQQELRVKTTIENKEAIVEVSNDLLPVEKGTRVVFQDSGSPQQPYYVIDIVRTSQLWWLIALFALIVVVIGGKQGVYALSGLAFSFFVIFQYVIPQIGQGANPIYIGLIGSLVILLVTLALTHGFNRKTIASLIGIGITLILVGLLASYSVSSLHFTGYSGEESVYLNFQTDNSINLVSILIAGILIASIGVLDDVAVTQSSYIFGLAKDNPSWSKRHLFTKGMVIGRDHIGAVINTLVLAYTGAALPLILLLSLQNFSVTSIINGEVIAEEIARTIISSIGLILAVPITTLVAVLMAKGDN